MDCELIMIRDVHYFSRRKRKMKKTIAMMMTGLMVLSLTACGS
jgi:hypothetical protein